MSAHGGQRRGAGRKTGNKNRLEKALAEKVAPAVEKAVGEGITPLEFLIEVLRDDKNLIDLRIEAAKAAAPYVHRKQPQDVNVGGAIPLAVSIITPLSNANPSNTGR